jgi:hypothetical protein
VCGAAVDLPCLPYQGCTAQAVTYSCVALLKCTRSQERDLELADALYTAHGHLGFSKDDFVKVRHGSCCSK